MLELHAHTTYSDGLLTPSELVLAASEAGVRALAITDHDTIDGWDEAIATAATLPHPMDIIPGVELSVMEQGRSLHLLGFFPEPDIIRPLLAERLKGRIRRVEKMIANLTDLGYPIIDSDQILTQHTAPGRPHIAQALVTSGHISRPQDAFDRWIGDGKPAYVPYEELSVADGLTLLRSAGAIASWAHPYLFRGNKIESMVPNMVSAGLMGLEVYHPSHTPSQQETLTTLCREWGLLKTGGSDYHGPTANKRHHLNLFHLPLGLLHPLRTLKSSQALADF